MGSADERGQPFRVAVREFCRLLGGDHGFQQVLVRELRGCFDVLHVSQITHSSYCILCLFVATMLTDILLIAAGSFLMREWRPGWGGSPPARCSF